MASSDQDRRDHAPDRRAVLVREVDPQEDALGRTGPPALILPIPGANQSLVAAGATLTVKDSVRVKAVHLLYDVPLDMTYELSFDGVLFLAVDDAQGAAGGIPLGSFDAKVGHRIDQVELTATNNAATAQNVRTYLLGTPIE